MAQTMTDVSLEEIIEHALLGSSSTTVNNKLLNLIKNLATELNKLKEEVTELRADNEKLKTGNNVNKGNSASIWKQFTKNTNVISEINSMVNSERNKITRKEKNLIITEKKDNNKLNNTLDPVQLKTEVGKILTAIGKSEHLEKTKAHRFKENGPIIMVCDSVEIKMDVIKVSRKLMESVEYKGVYINMDLTESELTKERSLRAEQRILNSRLGKTDGQMRYDEVTWKGDNHKMWWGIRNGELRKIYKAL